ncbi:amidase [Texcoconibacillus texcoconensis]|uniref:Amidase n=1 Tax=Texcoconibacillus texcoconensis TaxID=1095777 RepID=A0A840QMI0_9BACI|nr:amidase [Texcoconibacillus texcoconensis]MBB5172577.1 amidase [Texcoconibacillus texcoconensis]
MDLKLYRKLDATDIAELVRKKEVRAEEMIRLSFEQLEQVNGTLNAVVYSWKEKALRDAELGLTDGRFSGVPLLLKNAGQSVVGEPMTAGAKLLQQNVAKEDAHFVRKLREAGCHMVGHTNSPEFGLKNITEPEQYGPTRNPWNSDYSPGGSSGGAAAAVASGIVPVAGASDGGGSIRIPASFTGLVGLKPTRGRTPVGPGSGRQWQGAAIGFVLSRTVRDSAAMLDQLQVVQPEAAFQTPLFPGRYEDEVQKPLEKKLNVAYSTDSPVGTPVSEEAREAVLKTVRWLERQGHHVEEKSPSIDGVALMENYYLMNSGEISALVYRLERSLGRSVTPEDVEIETWLLNEAGKSVSAAKFTMSIAAWDTAAEEMARFHETYDVFITPTTAYSAPKVGELTHSQASQDRLRKQIQGVGPKEQQRLIYEMFLPSLTYTPFTQLANLTGQPALSLPLHLTEEGLPLGVQFITSKGREDVLLSLATQLESTDLWVGMRGNRFFE